MYNLMYCDLDLIFQKAKINLPTVIFKNEMAIYH